MSRQARSIPLPSGMQGRWLDAEEPSTELIVAGGEVTCFGRLIDYDCKEVEEVDGALTVMHVLLAYDAEGDFVLIFRDAPEPGLSPVRGDAVGCFMAR